MYECRNCGGNLTFDILTQRLRCAHCASLFAPEEVKKEVDASESEVFDVTVFTCPQCGAEILATENSAAEFCLYCGGSTILSSRVAKEQRPKRLIPFKITKDDCIRAYKRHMKRAYFAPRALKDPKHLKKFKGIYMPYWAYVIRQIGEVSLKGEHVKRQGDYVIHENFDLKGYLSARYDGLSHDASSYFSDHATEGIAPFMNRDVVDFEPSYLSGFYADTSDVEANVYEKDNFEIANRASYEKIMKTKEFASYHVKRPSGDKLTQILHTETWAAEKAMYPVWFLSYRNGDRVMYASVNGQTGKVAADVPIDKRKYLLFSLLLAVPLFFLFNLILVMLPTSVMNLATMLTCFTAFLYGREVRKLALRETGQDDKGKAFKAKKDEQRRRLTTSEQLWRRNERRKQELMKTQEKKRKTYSKLMVLILTVLAAISFFRVNNFGGAFIPSIMAAITYAILVMGNNRFHEIENAKLHDIADTNNVQNGQHIQKALNRQDVEGKWRTMGFLLPLIANLVAAILMAWNPVLDAWYYGAACVCGLAICASIIGILEKYNILSTHSVPRLHDRGGEQNAN